MAAKVLHDKLFVFGRVDDFVVVTSVIYLFALLAFRTCRRGYRCVISCI